MHITRGPSLSISNNYLGKVLTYPTWEGVGEHTTLQARTPQNVCVLESQQLSWLSQYVFRLLVVYHYISLIPFHAGPLTVLVNRSLTISNHNGQSVAFKVKTTAPKVRSGVYRGYFPIPDIKIG